MSIPTTSARTAAQTEASRENGSKSNGPVTEEGKAKSAQNSRRHGLCSDALSFATDDERQAYLDLHQAHLDRYNPADAAEAACVDRLTMAMWRQSLADGLEARYLNAVTQEDDETLKRLPSLATLCRYRARIERDYKEAMQTLQDLQCSRPLDLTLTQTHGTERTRPAPANDTRDPADNIIDLDTLGDTNEPEAPPNPLNQQQRTLNREERRRLEALRRKLL